MTQKLFLSFIICSFFFLSQSYAQKVDSLLICKNVEELKAIDSGTTFSQGEKVYCWMRINEATAGQEIKVEWYNEDKLMHTTNLSLSYASMRTYAYKTLHQSGKWKVVVKSADGQELANTEFQASS